MKIAGEGISGVAGPRGRWQLKFVPPAAGGPYTMTVTDGRRTIEFRNVMVGDVWICGGQSNMELHLERQRIAESCAQVPRAVEEEMCSGRLSRSDIAGREHQV